MSFDKIGLGHSIAFVMSQSLSSRAMSFDLQLHAEIYKDVQGLNPFRAGRCLSTKTGSQH